MPVCKPRGYLRPDVTRKGPSGRDHARLNLHLRRLTVELADQVIDQRQGTGNVFDDQGVAARIGHYIAAGREEFLHNRSRVLRLPITQVTRDGLPGNRQGLRLLLGAAGFGFVLQRLQRSNSKNVALQLTIQGVVLQHNGQRLVPGNVIQIDAHAPLDSRIQDHVESADLLNDAEKVLQVKVLEIQADGLAGIALADAAARHWTIAGGGWRGRLRLLLQSRVDRGWLGGQARVVWRLVDAGNAWRIVREVRRRKVSSRR